MNISHFFIDRPIFAAVISIIITILGAVAYFSLPVAQYPEIAPPSISVTASYPGASAEIVAKKIGWSPEAVLGAHKISGSLMSHDGTISMEALSSMQDTLLEYGVIKKKLPIEEHVAREFAPVKIG